MRLIDKARQHLPFDVPSGMAVALLATGLVEEFIPPKPVIKPNAVWQATEGGWVKGTLDSPVLKVICTTCGNKQYSHAPNAPDEKFLHCGTQETCPPDVAAQYKQLVKDFNGGKRERPTSQRGAEVRPHGYAVETI